MRRLALLPVVLLLAACVRTPPAAPAPAPTPVVVVDPAPAAEFAMPPGARVSETDARVLHERQLMVPVEGVRPEQVPDTYDAPRGGGRTHRAIDILAPRGTSVLAADAGLVFKVRKNRAGGRTVYMLDPERRLVYYYAHLDRWADGLAEGQVLAKGDVIGYVGTTGNAPRDTPHLHFQVMRLDDPKRYWDGSPLDPRPFFVHDGRPNAPDRQATR
jgi:murein DD-endopeptidase MepM/ murein hydrolase activator NlpD